MSRRRCVARRLWAKVQVSDSGCWDFTGVTTGDGYGRLHLGNGMVVAHRVAYELFVGPIPAGQVLDHTCRNRRCVNPDHLDVVTQRENLLRGDTNVRAHVEGLDCGVEGCVSCAHRRVRAAS